MDQPVPPPAPGAGLPPELAELLLLGQVLGQNQSFAIVAGRYSAAQAEALLRIRESRLYRVTLRNFPAHRKPFFSN